MKHDTHRIYNANDLDIGVQISINTLLHESEGRCEWKRVRQYIIDLCIVYFIYPIINIYLIILYTNC